MTYVVRPGSVSGNAASFVMFAKWPYYGPPTADTKADNVLL